MTQRLPTPGGDNGDWGSILNAYLEVSLSSTGTLNPGIVGYSQLDSPTQQAIALANTSVQTVNGHSPTSGAVTLSASDLSALTQTTADSRYIQSTQLGVSNGVATLTGTTLTSSQLPGSVVSGSLFQSHFVSVLLFGPGGTGSPGGTYSLLASGTARVGDGSGKTLANVYSTLSAAQANYSFVTSLTQTIDYCAIQSAINYLFGSNVVGLSSAINSYPTAGGGQILLPIGTYVVGTTIVQPGCIVLVGEMSGGSIFSDTDSNMPWSGTVIKLASSANCDLLQSLNFSFLNGGTTSPAYEAPVRLGFRNLVLDGNKANNISGRCVAYYTDGFIADNFIIQNAASDGFYCNSDTAAGYDHEAIMSNFRISDNGGVGLNMSATAGGPHDSVISNGFVARSGGVNVVVGVNCGSIMFSNIHSWGAANSDATSGYTPNWQIYAANSAYLNCQSDGAGIQVCASGIRWDGFIYGIVTLSGQTMITVGDGTTRTIQGCRITARSFNVEPGSMIVNYMSNTTVGSNFFDVIMTAGVNNKYVGSGPTTTLNGSQSTNGSTIAVNSTSGFPTSGTLYVGDITANATTTVSYTGISGNTFTGCTGGSSTSYASGAGLFLYSGPFGSPAYSTDTLLLNETGPAGSTSSYGLRQFGYTGASFGDYNYNAVVNFSAGATFASTLTMNDSVNMAIGSTNGTKIGTATTQKLGFYGTTPVVQQSTTGTSSGFTAGSGTGMTSTSTSTGSTGTTAYTFGDLVLALKAIGLLKP